MLKVELHTHTSDDPKDKKWITYSARQLVDEAIQQKFDVLGISCHNFMFVDEKLREDAGKRGLLLLFGIERDVEGKHVLLYNITTDVAMGIETFEDLRKARVDNPEMLSIAAHPPYWGASCLRGKIIEYLDLFDAWEHSFLHTAFHNPNKKMIIDAQKYGKVVIGNSDVHVLTDLGRTYTLVDAELQEGAVFDAIKQGKVTLVSRPLGFGEYVHVISRAVLSQIRHQVKVRMGKKRS